MYKLVTIEEEIPDSLIQKWLEAIIELNDHINGRKIPQEKTSFETVETFIQNLNNHEQL
ncbi:hypothetical protein [Aureivirga marina]|uniref:hypothetical protein n=1 Tax=Aureivirga marina TaxID=1182451 RepID=UPI0018CB0EC7|nr:hypothetical protein [Aureivirga marina]